MRKENIDNFFMSLDEFLDGAKDSVLFKKTAEEIRQKEEQKLIDEITIKNGRAWSILSGQVVGAEVF